MLKFFLFRKMGNGEFMDLNKPTLVILYTNKENFKVFQRMIYNS